MPPNIVLIMADQMIAELTGLYGHPVVRTPNLIALASRGVRFDAAYSPCPICAPARQCMMAGRYGSPIGIYDNASCLDSDIPCFTHYLANAGYDTVLSGKMHFVGPDQLHGFRARFVRNIYNADLRWTPVREEIGLSGHEMNVHLQPPDKVHYHSRQYTGETCQVDCWNANLAYDEEAHFRALQYLAARGVSRAKAVAGGKTPQPFCLTVSYHHPHEVFQPPREFWDLYEGCEIEIPEFPKDLARNRSPMDRWLDVYHGIGKHDLRSPDGLRRLYRAYYALVSYADHKVGQVLAALQRHGLAEDTVVVFTSDHGDMLCQREMVQKRTFYEWSCRVPLVIALPNGRGTGRTVQAPVNLVDLLPTFTDIAGVASADLAENDGASLLPLIEGPDDPQRATFAEMHTDGVFAPCFMVRQGRYKYVYIHGHGQQLFDLQADPKEWDDLAGRADMQDMVARMRKLILDRFAPDAIEADIQRDIKARRLIQRAMMRNGTSWNVSPAFHPERNSLTQYYK